MDIQELRREAQTMQPQLTADRRRLHRNPEAGAVLPETVAYVKGRLTEMGYHPQELGGGLTATVTGTDTGRCILLRADMDALRGQEQSGLSFRSENGCMHACGHDMHTAMLLGAARLLMQHRQELSGTVKLVFQPDEEGFTGAKAMLAAGVLQAPAPSEALALHVHSGTPSGTVLCGSGTFMAGCTLFRITVRGKGCHGAMPETGVDPIGIAAQIWLALQEITGRELSAKTPAVVTVGRFQAGQAPNIIPDEAVLEGTIRTFDRAVTARIMERIRQLSEGIASAFRGSAQMEELASAPPDGGYGGAGGDAAGPGEGLPAEGGRHGFRGFCLLHLRIALRLSAAGGRVPPGGSPLRSAHAQSEGGVQRGRPALGHSAADCRGHAPSGAVKHKSEISCRAETIIMICV